MTRSIRTLALVVTIIATLLVPLPASAEIADMSVVIDGLACPFCVYGIEKKFRGVDGISDVNIDLETGAAKLTVVDGKTPDLSQIRSAVKKAGFTPRMVNATVIGSPTIDDGTLLLHVRDSDQTYLLLDKEPVSKEAPAQTPRAQLTALAGNGDLAVIRGVLGQTSDGSTTLTADQVEDFQTFTFKVEGMRCEKCSLRLDTLLLQIKGVYRAVVDLDAKLATVESFGPAVDAETLNNVIEDAGFVAPDLAVR